MSAARRPRIAVVAAGLSQPSSTRLLADRLAAATATALRDTGIEPEIEVVELRDHAHALADTLLTGFPPPALRDAIAGVTGADAVIAVTPVFTASMSGLFKTFFDVLEPDALAGTPVLIGATGGTERHSLVLEFALRPLFAYLRTPVVPTAVYAASEDWASAGASGLDARIARAGAELAGLLGGPERPEPAGPYDDVVPFAQLLGGGVGG